ncbi:MAG: hypothetical protein IJX98_01835 [Clostridia bacterium]|nr:hypothetical protein [Clostridia bacterium]
MNKKLKALLLAASLAVVGGTLAACGEPEEPAHTHSYDEAEITWTWNADHSSATASVDCDDCTDGKITETDSEIETKDVTAPQLGQKGSTTYVAEVTINGTKYTDEETVTTKYSVATPTLASKVYTGSALEAEVEADAPYTIETNAQNAVNAGEYDVTLKLKDGTNNKWTTTDSETLTVKFTITKAENSVTAPTVANISCGETPAPTGATASYGTVSYVYATAEDGEYTAMTEFTAGTYYVKAVASETDNFAGATSTAASFTVSHNVASWDTTDAEYDYAVCSCGTKDTSVSFKKTVSGERQEVVLSGESCAIVLTGVSEYASIKSITLGENNLGTSLTLDVTTLKADTQNHGEQVLTAVVVDANGGEHTVSVPVLLVTKTIGSQEDFTATFTYNTERSFYGYYKLTADITGLTMKNQTGTAYNKTDGTGMDSETGVSQGFRGTFDGNGKTISGTAGTSGMFKLLGEGAVIKNLTVDVDYKNSYGGEFTYQSVFASSIFKTTFKDVTLNVKAEVEAAWGVKIGLFCGYGCGGNVFENVTVNAKDYEIYSLFGTGVSYVGYESHGGQNTYKNMVVYAKSVAQIGSYGNNPETMAVTTEEEGLFIYNSLVDLEENVIILTDEEAELQLTENYANATIVSVKYGEVDLGNSLTISTEKLTVADAGTKTFTVTVSINNKTVELSVVVKIDKGEITTEEETLTTARQDVVLSSTNAIALTLPEKYAAYTVEGIACGEYNLGTNLSALTIGDDFKAATANHGEQYITVSYIKDSSTYLMVRVPVLLVTKEISTAAEFTSAFTYTSSTIDGYYRLSDNITGLTMKNQTGDSLGVSYDSTKAATTPMGFIGTFDGNGKSITGTVSTRGMFGMIGLGGIVKNVTINASYSGDAYTAIFGSTIVGATLTEVTVNVTGNGSTATTNSNNIGLFTHVACAATTFTNVTVNAEDTSLYSLFGGLFKSSNAYTGYEKLGQNTYNNMTVKAKALAHIGNNGDTIISTEEGITVTLPAQTEEE